MKIDRKDKMIYIDQTQLECAVWYIVNNAAIPRFKYDEVKASILDNIENNIYAKCSAVSTSGYTILFNEDDSIIDIEILVDPRLGSECNTKGYKSLKKLLKKVS